MRLVIMEGKQVLESCHVPDFLLRQTIERIRAQYAGKDVEPLKYEVYRRKLRNGVAIVYRTYKKARMTGAVFERRALQAYSTLVHRKLRLHVKLSRKEAMEDGDGLPTPGGPIAEFDALDYTGGRRIVVEVTASRIGKDWIPYMEGKRKKAGAEQLVLIAPAWDGTCRESELPPDLIPATFLLDDRLPKLWYSAFNFPKWLAGLISHRHIRVLLQNGSWTGLRRLLSTTQGADASRKFRGELHRIIYGKRASSRRTDMIAIGRSPSRIYYTLSSMADPVAEFRGAGRPTGRLIAAWDVDGDDHLDEEEDSPWHRLSPTGKWMGACPLCMENAGWKAREVSDYLEEKGFAAGSVFSGGKGFHVYALREGPENPSLIEIPDTEMIQHSENLAEFADNINFRGAEGHGFDLHRIFRLPGSLDVATCRPVLPDPSGSMRFSPLSFPNDFAEISREIPFFSKEMGGALLTCAEKAGRLLVDDLLVFGMHPGGNASQRPPKELAEVLRESVP